MTPDDDKSPPRMSAEEAIAACQLGRHLVHFLTAELGVPNAGMFEIEIDDSTGEPHLRMELHRAGLDADGDPDPPHDYGTLYVKAEYHPWYPDSPEINGDLLHLRINEQHHESIVAAPSWYEKSLHPRCASCWPTSNVRRAGRSVRRGRPCGDWVANSIAWR